MRARRLSPLVLALGCSAAPTLPGLPAALDDAATAPPPPQAPSRGDPPADAGRLPDAAALGGVTVGQLPGVVVTEAAGARAHRGGDLDGDGAPELLLGLPDRGAGGAVLLGAVPHAGAVAAAALTALPGPPGAGVGRSVSLLGDQDGDGFAELMVAADAAVPGAPLAWVLHGPVSGDLDGAADRLVAWDDAPGGAARVRGAHLDDDGVADLLVGLPELGAVALWPGPHAGEFGLADAAAVLLGPPDAAFGDQLAVGDLDGDGVPDLAVGAPADDASAAQAGAVSVFRGPLTGDHRDADLVLHGAHLAAGLGAAVVADADLDDDGLADLVVSAPRADAPGPEVDAGLVAVVDGGLEGDWVAAEVAFARVYGPGAHATLGAAVEAGDLDGDGVADLAVGAPGWGGASADGRGAVVVLVGPLEGAIDPRGAALTLQGSAPRAGLGRSVALAGDHDQDGILDLVVGSTAQDPHLVLAAGWARD